MTNQLATINNPNLDSDSESDLDFDAMYIGEYSENDYLKYTENEKLAEYLYCIDYNT